VAVHGEDFVILACFVLTQYRSVTDGHTDGGRTPRWWLRRAKHYMLSCVKISRNEACLTYVFTCGWVHVYLGLADHVPFS